LYIYRNFYGHYSTIINECQSKIDDGASSRLDL
ncbi:hypothetical protein, partial [Salmonella enterica subsp. enterica serovar Enteritidis]